MIDMVGGFACYKYEYLEDYHDRRYAGNGHATPFCAD